MEIHYEDASSSDEESEDSLGLSTFGIMNEWV